MEASYSVISPLLSFNPVFQVAKSFKEFPGNLTFPMLNDMGRDRDDQFSLSRSFPLGGSEEGAQDGHILQVGDASVRICRESLYNASNDYG